ncbi:MAG: succinyl-diaminopimelate desuccinylase, partial [Rhodospirillales bacterium]|nr:succinyl-diaminopimelate desuccinylase [Rhodospirillales bacterium]
MHGTLNRKRPIAQYVELNGRRQQALERLGFTCHRLRFSTAGTPDVDNLYARIGGDSGPNFCFAGHIDVVPVGDRAAWSAEPFAAELRDGLLFGRGAADMKGAIAAFCAAASAFVAERARFDGSISLLITGDEEGPSINGTVKMLKALADRRESIDACVVGEPTNEKELGDMAKIGRRGSMNFVVTALGQQGHVAYPHLADNPNHHLVRMLAALTEEPLDQGTPYFQASSLQVTTIDVGNAATNVIPARATAGFNDLHTSTTLTQWVRAKLDALGARYELDVSVSGEAFLTPPGPLSDLVSAPSRRCASASPRSAPPGGTSDARFIRAYAPVIEFGLVGRTMHKVDERAGIADIRDLAAIYRRMLDRFFDASPGRG